MTAVDLDALGASTLLALERAGLKDLQGQIQARVLVGCPDRWWRELVLCEVRDTARVPHLAPWQRRLRVYWALTSGGC